MLNLVSAALAAEQPRMGTVRLDGTMTAPARAAALTAFADKPPHKVFAFLISLKAGGVGLNLVRANHCFMLDSWFNPAIEEQAYDRAYRIGQTKPTFMHKIAIKDSVEAKILALQAKKKKLADGALNQSDKSAKGKKQNMLTMDDLKNLFF
jgi:SNF2 family DNA or RNA helicase